MVDSIVRDKMKEFINQMGPLYQSASEEESVNDKNYPCNISTVKSANSVTMEGTEQMFHKCFNITIQNQM